MLRNRAVALILCCLASPLAWGLGLGPLEATSALNEPFKGRIEILGAKAEDFDALTIGLAGPDHFERAGIDRQAVLFQLRFDIGDATQGKDYITISSKDPIREPFLNFLLELNWANGRLMREYTVLLDPPLYDPNRRQLTTAPPAAVPQAMPAPRPAMPSTPSAGVAPYTSGVSAGGAYSSGREIGPVGANDTLWSLASAHRPDSSVSIQQMMLAILRQNPDAFSEGNVNMLRRGAVLRLPDEAAVRAIANEEAFAEVKRQHQLWEEYRQQIGATPAAQPLGTATAPAAAPPAQAPAETDARLELVAPGGTADGGGTPGKGTGTGSSELLKEQLDTSSQQSADLQDKLAEAEEIIDLLQRQVNIKDQELAALQARLAELGIEHGDLAVKPETGEAVAPAEPATVPTEAETTEEPSAATDESMEATPAEDAEVVVEDEEPEVAEEPEEPAIAEEAEPEEESPETASVDEQAATEVAPPAPTGFPASLVPPHIAAMVPGGALTVIAIVVLLALAVLALLARALLQSRAERPPVITPVPRTTVATVDSTVTAPTARDIDELPASEAITEFDPLEATADEARFDPNATVEAAAEDTTIQAQPAQPIGDPLEEVNVYLAYERFDQAEELVKRVIGEYPNRHEYKLRLLEVYYSSNDRAAYEKAARNLHDAVGEADPLWASALAMWSEMSPDRALFEEGSVAEAAPAPESAKAFVDITSDSDDLRFGESTLTQAPGGPRQGLDFDLAGGGDADSEVLDLTAAADNSEILDLTAAIDPTDSGEMLDLTAGEDVAGLDISGGDDAVLDLTDAGDLLDITGGAGAHAADILDITGADEVATSTSSDLLDVTKTGDVSLMDDHDLLNITSPGMRAHDEVDEPATASDLGRGGGAASGDSLDFDISDSVATVFDKAPGEDTSPLEFDIGGLDADDVPTVDMATATGGKPKGVAALDLDVTLGDDTGGGDLDFDITMGADELTTKLNVTETEDAGGGLEITMGELGESTLDGELSLKGAGLDELAGGGVAEEDFDFGFDGTTEMDPIAADDTIDMATAVEPDSAGGPEIDEAAALEELTMELDQAMANADFEDLGFGAPAGGDGHVQTVSLEVEVNNTGGFDADETVVLPNREGNVSSDADEADTKLNLAKAYIELGDTDGARSILDEVANDGTPAQKEEARALLAQLVG